MGDLATWQTMGVALALGLLVGAERERAHPGGGNPGIRTIALVALVGALTQLVDAIVAAGLVAGVVLMLTVGYWSSSERDPGMTSEVAAVATLGLGALAATRPALAVALAVTITVLLMSRSSLHRFVRETVTEQERADALKFFVAAFVVLPLLPDRTLGPYDVWVPHRIWLLVVLITAIGWVGYAATRALGARYGLLITGLAGGFVSATATTGVMAARARRGEAPRRAALAAAMLASVATLVQLVVITAAVAPEVTRALLPSAVAGSVVLLLEAWWLGRSSARDEAPTGSVPPGRPFALAPALILAGVISAVLPLAAWLEDRYGDAGTYVATAAGSLADVHGSSVAIASLVESGQITAGVAVAAIAVGLATNTVSKVVAAAAGGARFAAAYAAYVLPAAVGIAVPLLV